MNKRILVTGSRDFDDDELMLKALLWARQTFNPDGLDRITLVHGGARGADLIASDWAPALGFSQEEHPAYWNNHGKAAGHIRNWEMVKAGADICLAFPLGESRGTRGCMKLAEAEGILVVNVTEEGLPA